MNTSLANALLQFLRNELAALQSVLAALENEQTALAGNPEHLEACVQAKVRALEVLQQLRREREHNVAQLGMGPDLSLTDTLRIVGADAEAYALQQALQTLGDRCKQVNDTNALIVNQLQQQTRAALRILLDTDGELALYSPTGQSQHDVDRQSFGRA